MAERLPLGEVLRAVLAEDRTLLARREDLLAAMEQRVTPGLMRDYRSFQKAIQGSTVGEMVLAADGASVEERKSVCAQAMEILGGLGMQERAVLRVVETLVQGLGWSDEPATMPEAMPDVMLTDAAVSAAGEEEIIDVPAQEVLAGDVMDAPAVPADEGAYPPAPVPGGLSAAQADGASLLRAAAWSCVCGCTGNKGKFCVSCGRPRTIGETQPAPATWACRCGHMGNQGNFCVSCGTSRADGEVDPSIFWTCICGHHGNKGKFCVHCGRSRQEGEQLSGRPSLVWACRCGHHGNKGNFCVACGASRAEGEVETWICACGYQENTGRFCVNCGQPRPDGYLR